jgi:hypothetical protein
MSVPGYTPLFLSVHFGTLVIGRHGIDKAMKAEAARVQYYTRSSFKRNGNKRNEYLGVRKKCSTHFLGVRNAISILAGSEKKGKNGAQAIKIPNTRWEMGNPNNPNPM